MADQPALPDIAALRGLLERATPGPWTFGPDAHWPSSWIMAEGASKGQMHVAEVRGWGYLTGRGQGALGLSDEEASAIQDANAALIAAAISALPALLDTIAAQQAEVERLRKAPVHEGLRHGDKRAPVQGLAGGIPWSMHLRAYEAYSKKYSPQPALIDLDGRGCRGGFGTGELDVFIPGWREELSEIAGLRAELSAVRERIGALEGALRPFAAIKPSSVFAADGSEAESYQVHIWDGDGREIADFTGADLAAARALLTPSKGAGDE